MELVNDGSSTCVSDLVLDEWLADELDAGAAAATRAHVAGCARCSARKAERMSDREAFLREVPTFSALAARAGGTRAPVAARSRATRGGKVLAWSAAAAGAFALAATALLVPRDPIVETTRPKGAAHLGLFVKRGELVTRGGAIETVRPGDELRFTYSHPRGAYLALLNLDATAASVYFPSTASEAARVPAGSDVALDFSVELDGQLGQERVYGVFCEEPFAVEPVRAELQSRGAPPTLPGCQLDVITLVKVRAP